MKTAKILETAELMDHDQRWEFMIGLGRQSLGDPALATVLQELAMSGVHYERILALMSAHGSFDVEIIGRLLADPSAVGMGAAVKLAARYLDRAQLVAAAPALSKKKRQIMYKALLTAGRTDVAEELYIQARGAEQLELLPFTSREFLLAHLEENLTMLTYKETGQITRRFPAAMADWVEEMLSTAGELPWTSQVAAQCVLGKLCDITPVRGMELLKLAAKKMNTANLPLGRYAVFFPMEVARLVLEHPSRVALLLPGAVCRRLDVETICALAEDKRLAGLEWVFPKLRPDQRRAIYKTVGESLRGDAGVLSMTYIKALPRAMREAEARHGFGAELLESAPLKRLPYLTVLPFEEGLRLAGPYLNQPEGDLRAPAVAALVGSGRYYPDRLGDILDFCIKRENEQDPVRLAMMNALAGLPPTRWTTEHLPRIKEIIGAALRARDCSGQTMAAASDLLVGILPQRPDFACEELPVMVGRMGSLRVRSMADRISNSDMLKLDAYLTPLMKTWVARDQAIFAVSIIAGFGHRYRSIFKAGSGDRLGLIRLLVDLTQDKRGRVARLGLETMERLGLHSEVGKLIPQLIAQDESWVQVGCVSRYLHRCRQSLLTKYLRPYVYTGRFSSNQVAKILSFGNGFLRWTANQQQIYAQTLGEYTRTEKRNAWELFSCVNSLGAMPSIDLEPLVWLAAVDAKDQALRDKALEALGRADAGRGVPTLISALDDNRARVAVYALRRSVLDMPVKSALELLAAVPRNKVTVEKEVLRLAGEFEGKDAYDFLIAYAHTEDMHPDVRIALLRALWKHLNNEEVWEYFHAAATDERAALARSTIRIPQYGLNSTARKHLARQLTLLMQHENAVVRLEAVSRLKDMPIGEEDKELFATLAAMLEEKNTNISRLAAEALLAGYLTKDTERLISTFAAVRRPRSMAAVAVAIRDWPRINYRALKKCGEGLAMELLNQRRLSSLATGLVINLMLPGDILAFLNLADTAGLLHPEAVESNLASWKRFVVDYKPEITATEAELQASRSAGVRRLGLGLLLQAAKAHGWTEEYRERLKAYQKDAELWVAEPASMVEPPRAMAEMPTEDQAEG